MAGRPAHRRLPGGIYLKSRGLDPDPSGQDAVAPVDEQTHRLRLHAGGDHGDGRIACRLQETFLTAEGKKADVMAVRRTMRGPHDWNIRGLVRFGNPRAKKVFICEGVEDALSTLAAGAEYAVALTGIARLRRVDMPDDVKAIVHVRDDDAPGSPADDALGEASSQ